MFGRVINGKIIMIRVFITDDQNLFRKGLITLLKKEPGIEVVGEASDGPTAIQQVSASGANVMLLNVVLPVLDGISTARRLKYLHNDLEIVFISSHLNEDQLREAFEAGGRGFLLKDCEFDELVYAIKKAANGDYYISGPASQDLVSEYVKPLLKSQRPGGLMTPRERELARLLADGYSTKEAADVLNISPKTAETHRAAIMKKLNARNVTDIVKYCIRNHIIEM